MNSHQCKDEVRVLLRKMKNQIFSIMQIILGVILIVLVLLQTKGAGLGSAFGGDLSFYRTKRGLEKILFYMTIIVSTLFLTIALVSLIV